MDSSMEKEFFENFDLDIPSDNIKTISEIEKTLIKPNAEEKEGDGKVPQTGDMYVMVAVPIVVELSGAAGVTAIKKRYGVKKVRK